ncbi:MAG: hypothetical protein RIR11_2921 [Bacteroidota bacterium]
MSKVNIVLTAFDLIQFERHLHKHHQYMQHADKQAKAKEIIRNHIGFSMGAALVPFPGADLLAVSAVQLNMLRQLAKLYQVGFMDTLGKTFISAVAGTGAARLGASLIKAIPGVGTFIGELSMPVLSGASTYALGNVVAQHFHDGGTLEDFDLTKARNTYKEEIEEGKRIANELKKETPPAPSTGTDATLDRINKLAEMRDAGVLTEEEFTQMKTKLLSDL